MSNSNTKIAVVVLSDPSGGSQEATGRVFNALAVARDAKNNGQEAQVVFMGTGARWPAELEKPDHKAHDLYEEVKPMIGVSKTCAVAFGAEEDVESTGLPFLKDHDLPGSDGLPSLAGLVASGHTVMTF